MVFVLKIKDQFFKVSHEDIKEIVQFPARVHHVPLAEDHCLGMFSVRESVYLLFGQKESARDSSVVIGTNKKAIVVDSISLDKNSQESVPFNTVLDSLRVTL